jgi:hypothetical protein
VAGKHVKGEGSGGRGNGRRRPFRMDWVIGTGWVHTHGMAEHGLPEVEARHMPDYLAESAAGLIRHVCDYMLDKGKRVKAGETMAISPRTRFLFVEGKPLPGEEDHYEVERLLIVDVEHVCECCRLKPSDQN